MAELKILQADTAYSFRSYFELSNDWIFGILDASTNTISQDIGSYTLPDDVEDLVRILVGILDG